MWIRSQMDRALSWDTVKRIRDHWPRRLIIKGVLAVEDVEKAAELGADAVALSNHGGRQLDWAVAPLDVLPEARRAAGDRLAILVDGGVRRGSDVLKAMALGADAVLIGRAALYGVAAAGRPGASARSRYCARRSTAAWLCSARPRSRNSGRASSCAPPSGKNQTFESGATPQGHSVRVEMPQSSAMRPFSKR
jgi:isopentenyl diphosphate isomerase/L-lactate dehydrogenase-like FMN-dependent dehydrogenase